MFWIILIIIIALVVFGYIGLYNGLQTAKVYTEESWSQIDVQLKRRNDLIPNLVETTKGYAKHERETFAQVVQLRNQLVSLPSDAHQQKMEVSNQLTDTLKSIFALAENYPDLKANQEFTKLMEELTNTENKIAYSRQLFNSSAASFNQKLMTFPSNFIAKIHGMTKVGYLEVPAEEKVAPKVSFE
ncbi:LemA family protein [Liquorilactobacillus satsumensis]|uniref:LemA protein n=1 Tax=Liquorilactobacillus satsumensis DSM 16230 = JCM 12392 TaxID=1423801 RepID=A0A0R1V7Y5_9LACO|nr:LemA family protein [Liquorilactobacillus satsumensis]KRM00043.1 LemA protein [Liquorilactobacillus satsumensis DSM 16230 = JCM 12392]MCC7667002.1 LemA family protein [Liquorilactobacillus satsumensis]MCP9313586.1 LemA family protein [Liquorilactobacillus satsumensis]MCP9329700.1 LemA family protein [Liquorilactobacillus satsumensis]MCP9358158.1 LemA family protein [Liquorilactobacillus satsumensis]